MKSLLVKNPEDCVLVLETRGGKFAGIIREPGYHFVAPWKKVVSDMVTTDFSGIDGIGATTREQKNVCVSVAMNFTIDDPAKYHLSAKEPYKAAVDEIRAAARDIVGNISFSTLWNDRGYIAKKLHAKAAPVLREKFGMAFNDIVVQQISHDSMCMSAPDERLNRMMADVAAMPDKVAEAMGEGLSGNISVRKPLVLKR